MTIPGSTRWPPGSPCCSTPAGPRRPRPLTRCLLRPRHDEGVPRMRVALYARVSTESQQARGTIGSQLAVLRERVGVEGDEVIAEFCDDGHSGARLDRPGLDALRDAAEAGLIGGRADRAGLVSVPGSARPRLRL